MTKYERLEKIPSFRFWAAMAAWLVALVMLWYLIWVSHKNAITTGHPAQIEVNQITPPEEPGSKPYHITFAFGRDCSIPVIVRGTDRMSAWMRLGLSGAVTVWSEEEWAEHLKKEKEYELKDCPPGQMCTIGSDGRAHLLSGGRE